MQQVYFIECTGGEAGRDLPGVAGSEEPDRDAVADEGMVLAPFGGERESFLGVNRGFASRGGGRDSSGADREDDRIIL